MKNRLAFSVGIILATTYLTIGCVLFNFNEKEAYKLAPLTALFCGILSVLLRNLLKDKNES